MFSAILDKIRSDDEDVDIEQADDDKIAEAAERLQREDGEITSENLREKLDEIEREAEQSEREGRTGAIRSPIERSEADRLSVAPEQIVESETYLKRTNREGKDTYARSLIVSDFPARVAAGWLDQLFTNGLDTNGAHVRVSYHMWPRDSQAMMQKLDVRATRLLTNIKQKEKQGKINTTEEQQQLEQVNRLREGLTSGSTKLFDFALYVEVVADDEQILDEGTEEVRQIFRRAKAEVTPLYDRQLDAQRAAAPLGDDPVRNTQIMDVKALGTTFPFIEPSVVQPTGVLTGFHQTTNSPVVVDRFEQSGHNMLISGKIGSGKSYLAKLVMWRRLMMDPETEILMIDPVGGFADMVDAVGGQRITIDSTTRINPLEIKEAEVDELEEIEGDPYDDKIRSVMGLFRAHFQGRRELSKEEDGVLRRAIRLSYLQNGITKDLSTHGNTSPTIQDMIDILRNLSEGRRPEEFLDAPEHLHGRITQIASEAGDTGGDTGQRGRADGGRRSDNRERESEYAHSVLLGLEDFRRGGQRANLNGQTNVALNDRVVQFDLSAVADGNSAGLFMHIVLDWLFQRAKTSTGRTLVTIDEAHYMLGQEQALDMLNLFARHSRHYDSGMTIISQTVDEFMQGKAKEIYDQCDIRALMRHEDLGEQAMQALNLSETQRNFVLQAQAGNSAPYSESLLYVTDIGTMRLNVHSNEFEHHVIDGGVNAWAYLYRNDMIDWKSIPPEERREVERRLGGS